VLKVQAFVLKEGNFFSNVTRNELHDFAPKRGWQILD